MDHTALVEHMKTAAFYPHRVADIRFMQTHISCIFLTGELVYKLKKRVDFGFLDFTTLESRKENCERELHLNRRLAPSVYLRVEPVTLDGDKPRLSGSGTVVDWVVVMRQLDQELLGLRVLERGELDGEKIDAVVDTIVPFYQAARTGPGVDEFGGVGTAKFNTDENFEQTAAFVGLALSRERYDEIRSYTDSFYQDKGDLLEARIPQGWIRECHGDLHLGNIFFEKPPVIFDCIEFNERLRCLDVAVDLAFMVMDLDFQGKPELARRFVNRYVTRSGDAGFLDLVDFFACYRAYVRGKIACLTSADPAIGEAGKIEQLDLASRYFELAHHYATEGGHGKALT